MCGASSEAGEIDETGELGETDEVTGGLSKGGVEVSEWKPSSI